MATIVADPRRWFALLVIAVGPSKDELDAAVLTIALAHEAVIALSPAVAAQSFFIWSIDFQHRGRHDEEIAAAI